MRPRQHQRWLFTDDRLGPLEAWIARLPAGAGIVVRQGGTSAREQRRCWHRLARIARRRGLALVEDGDAARVHDMRELRRALDCGARLIFISALHPTRSHPGRAPLPRMRAATLARHARGRALALGGMDEQRYAAVAPLGFIGWGGIDAWAVRI